MTIDDAEKATGSPLPERLREALAAAPVEGIVSAYLFGSHATGRAHRESDIDVAVLLDWQRHPTRRERFAARLRLIGNLLDEGYLYHVWSAIHAEGRIPLRDQPASLLDPRPAA